MIDKVGIIRYVDVHDIDEQPDNEVLFKVLSEMEPQLAAAQAARNTDGNEASVQAPASSPAPAPDEGSTQAQHSVMLYCTPWCPDCKRSRLFFSQNEIPYTEIDITKDREAARRVRGWANGYETTPTYVIDGSPMVGYNPDKLRKLLGLT